MKKISNTQDGVSIYNGVFKFYDTHGLPLSDILELLKEQNAMPCMFSFYVEATLAGWNTNKIKSSMREAVADVYGRDFCEEWVKRFDEMVKTCENS